MKFVVGMHRSGTSLVANLLRDLGVNFGDDQDLLPPQPDNPDGFLENKDVVEVHDELLRDLGGDWFNPVAPLVLSEKQVSRINSLRTQLEEKSVVGVKDPRMSLFLPYWISDADELLVCIREPQAVANSLSKRNHLPLPLGCALWLIYNYSIFSVVESKNAKVIDYSDLLKHSPDATIELAAFSAASKQSADNAIDNRVDQTRVKDAKASMKYSLDTSGEKICILADEFYSCVKNGDRKGALALVDPKMVLPYLSDYSKIIQRSESLREESQKLNSTQRKLEALIKIREEELGRYQSLARAHSGEVEEHQKLYALYKDLLENYKEEQEENKKLLAKYESEQEKADYLFRVWNNASSQIVELNDTVAVLEAREDQFLQELYDFKQSVVHRLLYFIYRVYKFVTFRRGRLTFFDKLFVENHVPVKYRRQGKVRSLYNLSKFILQNPGIAVHNVSIRNAELLLRKFTGNKADLAQWLNARMPLQGNVRKMAVEKFELDEVIQFRKYSDICVSIVVPVYNNIEITLSLLKSIQKHTMIPYEVIVADDCSTDETQCISRFVENVVHVRNQENKGFLLNCNNAAQQAQGEIVLFLNNDTNVTEGWLEPLVESFDDPSVGVAGPKILFVDGKLQEAGGIIWQDASGWNYGRMGDPEAPEFNYLKEVDYVSGCCLAIRKGLWEEIGGFDERYVPAYYEDTDLCFEVRAKGFKVIYQPASTIIHLEGASHGTDTTSGIKKFQVVNNEKFRGKWKPVLDSHKPNGVDVFHSRDRSHSKKTILFIDHYVPHYDQDAGSRAVFMYLKILIKMGYNVKFVGDNFYRHEPYTSALQAAGIEVLYGNYYATHMSGWIRENRANIDLAFINRPHIGERYIDLLNECSIKTVYFGHDLHFLRLKRQAEVESSTQALKDSERWKSRELALIKKSDVVYYPSTLEVEILAADYGIGHARVLPLFSYPVEQWSGSFEPDSRKGTLFVGGFGHPPNVDAVKWLHDEIYPKLDSDAFPIYIVGSNVPEEIKALADDNFRVLGYLTDEKLSALYASVKLVAVPLRFGAGVKGKILEALYHSIPVVSTSVGLEGISDIDNVAVEANASQEFASMINRLVNEPDELISMSVKSKEFISANFSEDNIRSIFERDIVEVDQVEMATGS